MRARCLLQRISPPSQRRLKQPVKGHELGPTQETGHFLKGRSVDLSELGKVGTRVEASC